MKTKRHGISIGLERVDSDFFLSLKVIGKLTHDDYKILTPMIDSALEGVSDAKINAFIDASELEGWEARAAWDDFRLGLKHRKEFNRIAIQTNKRWLELSAKVGSWFISGDIKCFEDHDEAIAWLGEESE